MMLSETCEGLEQQRSKLQSELTAKENHNAFLTGQFNNSKATLEKEVAQVRAASSSTNGAKGGELMDSGDADIKTPLVGA